MKSQNSLQAKGLARGYSFIISLVFALFLSGSVVFAYTPSTSYTNLPSITNTYYWMTYTPYNKTYIFFQSNVKHTLYLNNTESNGAKNYYQIATANGTYSKWQYKTDATTPTWVVVNSNTPIATGDMQFGFQTDNYVDWGYAQYLVFTSYQLKDHTTNAVVYEPNPPSPPTNASIVKFIQPSVSPFKDTTSSYNFLISYVVPPNTPVSSIDISVNSPNINSSDWSITNQEHNVATGEGWLKCLAVNVSVGSHIVTATINTKVTTTTIERLGGSVDADGDGIDDRTNLPVDTGSISAPGGGIEGIKGLTDFLASMKDFSTQLFSFMPTEVKVIMVFVITVMGFIAVKKFIL